MKKALIIVDVQNDFLPNGALPVKEGDEIIPVINELLQKPFDLVVATKDWHPKEHGSFAANHPGKTPGDHISLEGVDQILWPVHCVQGSFGAEFSSDLDLHKVEKVCYKGTEKNIDSYSAFFDNAHAKATGLADYLDERHITDIYLVGLATDYCVKFSALDSLMLGYNTFVIIDACRGVNLKPNDTQEALEEIEALGGHLVRHVD